MEGPHVATITMVVAVPSVITVAFLIFAAIQLVAGNTRGQSAPRSHLGSNPLRSDNIFENVDRYSLLNDACPQVLEENIVWSANIFVSVPDRDISTVVDWVKKNQLRVENRKTNNRALVNSVCYISSWVSIKSGIYKDYTRLFLLIAGSTVWQTSRSSSTERPPPREKASPARNRVASRQEYRSANQHL